MRKYELVPTEYKKLVEFKCDICGLNFMEDSMEEQECCSFYTIGGYSSVFGDGSKISLDICQHCFKEKLGEYCSIS